MSKATVVIIGASSGVGRALTETLAEKGANLILVARDERDLKAICCDLMLRYTCQACPFILDLAIPAIDADELYTYSVAQFGPIDTLLIPAGYISPDDKGVAGKPIIQTTICTNYLSVLVIIAKFAQAFEQQGYGQIVAFSSIAAAVPRRRNLLYASAKAGLESYLRGLRHHFADTNVIVQGYALGYVDTSMSFGQNLFLPMVSPKAVAHQVVKNLDKDVGVIYFPRYWQILTMILRLLPWGIYKRLSF